VLEVRRSSTITFLRLDQQDKDRLAAQVCTGSSIITRRAHLRVNLQKPIKTTEAGPIIAASPAAYDILNYSVHCYLSTHYACPSLLLRAFLDCSAGSVSLPSGSILNRRSILWAVAAVLWLLLLFYATLVRTSISLLLHFHSTSETYARQTVAAI